MKHAYYSSQNIQENQPNTSEKGLLHLQRATVQSGKLNEYKVRLKLLFKQFDLNEH